VEIAAGIAAVAEVIVAVEATAAAGRAIRVRMTMA